MAEENEPTPAQVQSISAVPAELAQMLGFDVPRTWATAVQIFSNPDHVLFIFRETVAFQGNDSEAPELGLTTGLQRNVGSVIMPLGVAREFSKILAGLIGDEASSTV